jgi:hypothetical protein
MSNGPFDYNYISKIKSPTEAGATTNGDIPSLGKDKDVLMNYAEVLWGGNSNSNVTTDRSLGDAYFYETPQDCTIQGTNDKTKRYIYVDNVPKGTIGNAKGLLPGMIEDLGIFNPTNYIADLIPTVPECISVSLEVVGDSEQPEIQSHYMALSDVKIMDPCSFPDKLNPALPDGSNQCQSGFTNKYNIFNKNIGKYIYLSIFIIIVILLFIRYK